MNPELSRKHSKTTCSIFQLLDSQHVQLSLVTLTPLPKLPVLFHLTVHVSYNTTWSEDAQDSHQFVYPI